MAQLVDRLLAGNTTALARVLTLVEDRTAQGEEALQRLYGLTGKAWIVGITGATGSGKSSLTTALTKELRRRGRRVGIVAVDPSSPFSRGALLGDRVRMHAVAEDPDVFIRSMASRGSLGGLADTTADVVAVLDAAGYDVVLVETVGAGQDEVEILSVADTTLVVIAPESGDDVQAVKAGILEIADVFVITKADLPNSAEAHLRLLLSVVPDAPWCPPLVKTSSLEGFGLDELADAIFDHERYLRASDVWESRRLNHARRLILTTAHNRLLEHIAATAEANGRLESLVEAVAARRMDPHQAANTILGPYLQQETN